MCKWLITSSLSLSVRPSTWVQRSLIEGVIVSTMMGFGLFICISPLVLCCVREFNDILGFPKNRCASVLFSLSTAFWCACHAFFSFLCSVNHSLATHPIYIVAPSQMGPPFITYPFPFITHLFLSSFHSFHCLASLMLPFKLCPAAIPHVAGHHLTPLVLSSSTIQLPSCVSLALPQLLWKPLTWPHHPPLSALHCCPSLGMGHQWTLLLYQLCTCCHLFIFFHYFPFIPFVHHLSPFVFTPSRLPFPFMPLTPTIHPVLTPVWYVLDSHSSYCLQCI